MFSKDRSPSSDEAPSPSSSAMMNPLRVAAAQLLIATSLAAGSHREPADRERGRGDSIADFAPLLVGPLAAVVQLEHVRRPRSGTTNAARLMNGAVIALGSALFMMDWVRRGPRHGGVGPLSFASAGILAHLLTRHEEASGRLEADLRKRAAVVERLVPRRKAKVDRIVIHV